MSLIKDIRFFESDVPNTDGNPIPHYIGKIYRYDQIDCLDVIQRLLFLLRHKGFGFDGFDHLYLNFTPCLSHNQIADAQRHNIREFSWYHYVDIGCDSLLFNTMTLSEKTAFILGAAKQAVLLKAPEEQKQLFLDSFNKVTELGEKLLLSYKMKENSDFTAEILFRINNELDFMPAVIVKAADGSIKAEQNMRAYGRDEFISQFGTLTLGKSYFKITPRKNWHAEFYGLKPIKIEW